MRFSEKIYILSTIALSSVLGSCGDVEIWDAEAKAGVVTADGYVDLSPPITYSPKRGIICESYSADRNGKLTGECFDLDGPSVSLTKAHISLEASKALQKDIDSGRFADPNVFKTVGGLICDLNEKRCRFKRFGLFNTEAIKHSEALFWNVAK